MHKITIRNNKQFSCDSASTIFNGAKESGILLEHSCLSGRCRSCKVKVLSGTTKETTESFVLSEDEKNQGYVLSCTNVPLTDLSLDVEDLEGVTLSPSQTVPCKIDSLELISNDVVRIIVRTPPNSNFKYISGQYVNLIKDGIRRSYSVANYFANTGKLEFFIKNYTNGIMSKYLFESAKVNDLLRMEGPLGTFFLRKLKYKNLVFLATGTGIAPIKAILEQMETQAEEFVDINVLVFYGARHEENLFWTPYFPSLNLKYFPTLSQPKSDWESYKGYIQNIVVQNFKDIKNSQVYACGSNAMIEDAKSLFINEGLDENDFYSDIFVSSN